MSTIIKETQFIIYSCSKSKNVLTKLTDCGICIDQLSFANRASWSF